MARIHRRAVGSNFLLGAVLPLSICCYLLSCGDDSSRARETAIVQNVAPTPGALVRDTIRTVYQETLRTVVFDTIRTVAFDTHSTVVTETLRVMLMEPELESPPAVPPRMSAAELKATRRQIQEGRLSPDVFGLLTRNLPQLYTVSASQVDTTELQLIADLAGVRMQDVSSVRWGRSMAPIGHPRAGGSFLTVWTTSLLKVVRVDSLGTIEVDQSL